MNAPRLSLPRRYGNRCFSLFGTATLATLATLALSAVPVSADAQSFDRSKPPALGAPARLTVPAVRHATLANGISLSIVEQHELPLVQVVATFSGGARLDGSRPGLAAFTATMLKEGAGTRDANALQSELAYLGATLNTAASWDAITVSLKVPLRSLGPALDLMSDVIQRPTFSTAEVRRQRDLRLTSILQRRDQPGALASLAFHSVVFPQGHPYHNPLSGDSATTASIDSAALRAFYAGAVRPEQARFIVVGDIAEADARTHVAQRFGTWRPIGRAEPLSAVSVVPHVEGRTHIYLVDKPAAAQSVIILGWPGVDRLTPDYAPLMVMNSLLGGSFTSRLNMNLREAHGYSYGAGSDFDFNRSPGPFTASAAVRTNATDSSLVEFFKELRKLRDSVISSDELARARSYVELALPGSLESTSQVAGTIAELSTFGLPLSDLTSYATKVRAVTPADVQRVARKYLTPNAATVVVVGDLTTIRASIDALKLGEVTVVPVSQVAR
ncbi:MAG: pitrilysin family protein [Gemmatimonadaceae bacterium]